jgi:glycine dehydrogenase subunit 2
MAYDTTCMHEFVMSLERCEGRRRAAPPWILPRVFWINGIHPPTMYFPLIVHEALMIEPCETESRETLDHAVEVLKELKTEAEKNPEALHTAPHYAAVTRLDEVAAARHPRLRWEKAAE